MSHQVYLIQSACVSKRNCPVCLSTDISYSGSCSSSSSWMKPGEKMPCRSEEHTSELQSLMRISYAVFCLKKKTQNKLQHEHDTLTLKSYDSYSIQQKIHIPS